MEAHVVKPRKAHRTRWVQHKVAALAAAMEVHVVKPRKAHGTRWVQHKVAALAAAMEAHVVKPRKAHGTRWMQHRVAALAAAMEAHVVKPRKAHGTRWMQHRVAALAAAMEAHVVKPRKAHGTRWVQHKVAALAAAMEAYVVKPRKAHGTRWVQHKVAALAAAMEAYVVKPRKAHGTRWVQHKVAALAAAMEAYVVKPRKAHGTRWMQHKVAAGTAILPSYDVLTAHLESMSADLSHDQAKAKGYLTKMTTFKFVVHLVFIVDLLQPLSKLSLAWQKDATEIPHMLAAERAMKAALARLRAAKDDETALSKPVKMEASRTASFKSVSLTRVEQGTSFFTSRRIGYIDKVTDCCKERFCHEDSSNTFNTAFILDTNMWSNEHEQLRAYGNEKVSFAADHFASTM